MGDRLFCEVWLTGEITQMVKSGKGGDACDDRLVGTLKKASDGGNVRKSQRHIQKKVDKEDKKVFRKH